MSHFTEAEIIAANVDPETYHAINADTPRGSPSFVMGRSDLLLFAECPMRWKNGYERPGSAAKENGNLTETIILQPERFEERYAVCPETYPDAKTGEPKPWNFNAAYCKDWRKSIGAREPIKAHEHVEALEAKASAMADLRIAHLLTHSEKQVMITANYRDAATGITVPLRALIDLVPDKADQLYGKALADFKTARSAQPRAWRKACWDYGYDAQAAFYLDLHAAATGEQRTDWLHAIIENVAPYQTARRWMSAEFVGLGRARYRAALVRYAACLASGDWPDYDQTGLVIDGWAEVAPEPWMMMQEMDVFGAEEPEVEDDARPPESEDHWPGQGKYLER